MKVRELFTKIRDAIRFIAKPLGVSEIVITEAALAATKVIRDAQMVKQSEKFERQLSNGKTEKIN